ncbi:HET domain-containing protein [Fusarium sp. Ph1]|nr:HET domain-containing protein [Fusarium sp. Ph1]
MGHIAPLDIQDPSDLDAILRDRRLLDLEVYVWEPTRKYIEYRHRLGASELYYQGEPDDIGTSGTLPIKPDGIWQSLPPCSTREYSCPRKLPDASIVVAEHEKSVKEALCEQCAKIPVGKLLLSEQSYKLCDKASHLDVNSCRLCRMIFRHIKKSIPSQDDEISLSVKLADGIFHQDWLFEQQTEQVSLAILHGTESKEYFRLLQKWLDESSASGRELCPYYLPSRLIHITHSEDHFKLRLIKTEEFKFSSPRYIALSHRWGGIDTFCTTADNFHERLNDIPYSELPKTFQHAVITTWNLGVKYLWIDSLCIIQRNASDWRH